MTRILLATPAAAALLLATLALVPAGSSEAGVACFTITDPDQRALCRAQQSHSSGDCSFIRDYAQRQTCRARLAAPGKGAAQCNTITDQWQRQKCRDEAARR